MIATAVPVFAEYHKIQTIFKRDERTKRIIVGDYSLQEFAYLADNEWVWTEKVDGTNVRIYWPGHGAPILGGRTDAAQMPTKLVAAIQGLLGPTADRFREVFGETPATIFGEGYGAGIQSGGNYRPDQGLVVFDVQIGEWWLERHNVEDVAAKFGLDVVPIALRGSLHEAVQRVADGIGSHWSSNPAEGLVGRPATELRTRRGDRLVAKIKHRDFAR